MLFTINITPTALEDIELAFDYYNSSSQNLGFRFVEELDNSLQFIAALPESYGYRYENVRVKLLTNFPFLIFFTINKSKFLVEVLRVFHTSQDPYWIKNTN